MQKGILNPVEVRQMLQSGMTKADIARHFKVSKSAVSQCCKNNDIAVNTQLVKDRKTATALIRTDRDIMNRISRIMNYTEDMIEMTRDAINGDTERQQYLRDLGVKDIVKTSREINNDAISYLKTYIDIQATIFNVQQSMIFQRAVVDALKEERNSSPESKAVVDRIIERIRKDKSLESLFS